MVGIAVAIIVRSYWYVRTGLISLADPYSGLTNATRKMDKYTPMTIVQNLRDFGW
jgi:hypothetical protein